MTEKIAHDEREVGAEGKTGGSRTARVCGSIAKGSTLFRCSLVEGHEGLHECSGATWPTRAEVQKLEHDEAKLVLATRVEAGMLARWVALIPSVDDGRTDDDTDLARTADSLAGGGRMMSGRRIILTVPRSSRKLYLFVE